MEQPQGVLISDSVTAFLVKLMPDGSQEWYKNQGGWVLDHVQPIPANSDHTHSDVKLELKTDAGILVFENGILVKVGK